MSSRGNADLDPNAAVLVADLEPETPKQGMVHSASVAAQFPGVVNSPVATGPAKVSKESDGLLAVKEKVATASEKYGTTDNSSDDGSVESAESAGEGIAEGGDTNPERIDVEKLRNPAPSCGTSFCLTIKDEGIGCLEMVPKFGDGGGWQIATSLMVNGGATPSIAEGGLRLAFAAGGGGAIWIFAGNYVVGAFKPHWNKEMRAYVDAHGWGNYLLKHNMLNSLLWAVPGFFANGVWQTAANAYSASGLVWGGIKTGFCTGATFLVSLVPTRGILSCFKNSKHASYVEPYNFKENGFWKNPVLWSDAEISVVNVTAAAGMFVWTDFNNPLPVQTTNKLVDLGKDVLKSSGLTIGGYSATRTVGAVTKAAIKSLYESGCCLLGRKKPEPFRSLAQVVPQRNTYAEYLRLI